MWDEGCSDDEAKRDAVDRGVDVGGCCTVKVNASESQASTLEFVLASEMLK